MADDFLGKFMGNHNRAKLLRVFVLNQRDGFTATNVAKMAGISAKSVGIELRYLEQMGVVKQLGKLLKQAAGETAAASDKSSSATPLHKASGVQGKGSQDRKKEQVWTFHAHSKQANAISKFVYEVSPPRYDNVVTALRGTGRPTAVILSGCFVGDLTRPADIIVAGDSLNERRLEKAIRTLEPSVGRELRYASFTTPEFRYRLTIQDRLMRDTFDYPHLVLLDRTRLL